MLHAVGTLITTINDPEEISVGDIFRYFGEVINPRFKTGVARWPSGFAVGGIQTWMDSVKERFIHFGGELLLETSAEEILVADGKVWGVRIRQNNGSRREVHAGIVVSNIPTQETFRYAERSQFPEQYVNRTEKLKSYGSISLTPNAWITREVGPDADTDVPMGIIAEGLAEEFGISREEQDQFGLRSQTRALAAIEAGYFKEEIVPVEIPQRKGDPIIFDRDEHPRATSLEKLAALKPSFKKDGTVTAGTSSGLNDGGVAILMMSKEKADELGYQPMARFVGAAAGGAWPPFAAVSRRAKRF